MCPSTNSEKFLPAYAIWSAYKVISICCKRCKTDLIIYLFVFTELNMGNNKLTYVREEKLPLHRLINLVTLDLSHNQLTKFGPVASKYALSPPLPTPSPITRDLIFSFIVICVHWRIWQHYRYRITTWSCCPQIFGGWRICRRFASKATRSSYISCPPRSISRGIPSGSSNIWSISS